MTISWVVVPAQERIEEARRNGGDEAAKKQSRDELVGLAGASAGALAGAAVGSVVPVVGTAIGFVLGGLFGAAKAGEWSSKR